MRHDPALRATGIGTVKSGGANRRIEILTVSLASFPYMPFEGQPVHLTAAQRNELEEIAGSPALAGRFAQRARIVLLLAEGVSARAAASKLGVSRPTIAQWRRRFLDSGVEGLASHYPGRAPWKLTARVRARVLAATRRPPPGGRQQWSCRRLAVHLGVSKDVVQRAWREADPRPDRLARYIASTEPDFKRMATDIVGLYLVPPRHAAVAFRVDEKTAIEPPSVPQRESPPSPGRAEERTSEEFGRHGVVALHAALSTRNGRVPGKTAARHSEDLVAFLGEVVATSEPNQQLHVILDTRCAQRTKTLGPFLDQHPDVRLHVAPTHSSWLQQVERWLSKLQPEVPPPSIRTSTRSLARQLRRYIEAYARQGQPHRWIYRNPAPRPEDARPRSTAANPDERVRMRRPLPIRTDRFPVVETELGRLYRGDCLEVLPEVETESVDLVFADPPFNLGKDYGERVRDRQQTREYLQWCRQWLQECVRTLRAGGAFFVYNLPRWNVLVASCLQEYGLKFRHWIAVEQAAGLPIPGQLYPAHYSLLYYSKGAPKTFRRLRTPIETCRHCGGEIKDYGGHRSAMNVGGVSLKDIWTDIPPVRHARFKPASRRANALSTKLLERVVEMSSEPGDIVLDPFGGSGTTYAVCEQRGRGWIGVEIESVDPIIERLSGAVENHSNRDLLDNRPR